MNFEERKERINSIYRFSTATSHDQSNFGKQNLLLFLEIQAGRTNSGFPKTSTWVFVANQTRPLNVYGISWCKSTLWIY